MYTLIKESTRISDAYCLNSPTGNGSKEPVLCIDQDVDAVVAAGFLSAAGVEVLVMSCRLVRFKKTFVLTLVRSRGTGIYDAMWLPP